MVVVSVTGVLLSLVIPAVQRARETGREASCRARMRQLGVALHGFVSVHGGLPPLAGSLERSRTRSDNPMPPHVALLPWLEQSALAGQVRELGPAAAISDPRRFDRGPTAELLRTPIAAFRCPSDSGRGRNNMVFCAGSQPVARVDPVSGYWGDGPFPMVASLPLARVTDGLSQTAAVSERLTGSGIAEQFDPQRDFWFSGADVLLAGSGDWPPDPEILISVCDAGGADPGRIGVDSGWSWAAGRYNGAAYNHSVPPNSAHLDCTPQAWSPYPASILHGVFRSTSLHHGGVNQLLLDGSVRFVSNAIDATVYRSLATRAGGDSTGDASF